jgi:hypothetical protein
MQAVRIAASAAVLLALLWFIEWREIAVLLAAVDPLWLAAALIADLAGIYFISRVFRALIGSGVKASTTYQVTLISIYFGTFVPSEFAAGVMSRLRYMTLPWRELVYKTLLDRFVCLAGHSAIAAAAVPMSSFAGTLGHGAALFPVAVLFACIAAIYLLVRRPRILLRLTKRFKGIDIGSGGDPVRLFVPLAWALVAHMALSAAPMALLWSLGIPVSYLDSIVVGYALAVAYIVPFFFAGVGIRDATSVMLFSAAGMGATVAIAFSTLVFALILVVAAIGAVLQLWLEAKRSNAGPSL